MSINERAHEKFVNECLQEHNLKRRDHGAPPLRHCAKLDRSAHEWANQLLQRVDKLCNSPASTKGEVGENISMRSSTAHDVDLSGKDVVDQWYSDKKNYNFSRGTGPAGNFTQLIWKGTKEVGFGKAKIAGRCIVVAHYRPPGNVLGRYLENVQPYGSSVDQPIEIREQVSGEITPAYSTGPRKTKETVESEQHVDDDGRVFELRRKIMEFTDEDGKVTQKVEESRIYESDSGGTTPSDDSCNFMDEDKFEKSIKNLSEEEKHFKRHIRKFTKECLEAHNYYRIRHGVPKVKINTELSNQAQTWADHLVTTHILSNSGHIFKGGRLGENIGSRWSNGPCDYSGREIVEHWYGEEKKFNYDKEPQSVQGIGNFSQMIWKSTTEIGIGKAILHKKGSYKVVIVVHYYPCGNVIDSFKENVPRPVK